MNYGKVANFGLNLEAKEQNLEGNLNELFVIISTEHIPHLFIVNFAHILRLFIVLNFCV